MRLPQQLQRAMAAEAEASREARAKVQPFVSNMSLILNISCVVDHLCHSLLLKVLPISEVCSGTL